MKNKIEQAIEALDMLRLPIDSAPIDGTEIYGVYDEGYMALICWSEKPICMLGARNGSFPAGWATGRGETDNNLPMDEPDHWLPIEVVDAIKALRTLQERQDLTISALCEKYAKDISGRTEVYDPRIVAIIEDMAKRGHLSVDKPKAVDVERLDRELHFLILEKLGRDEVEIPTLILDHLAEQGYILTDDYVAVRKSDIPEDKLEQYKEEYGISVYNINEALEKAQETILAYKFLLMYGDE